MKESGYIIVLSVITVLMGVGFFMTFDLIEDLQREVMSLEQVAGSSQKEIMNISNELKFTETVVEKALSGEW